MNRTEPPGRPRRSEEAVAIEAIEDLNRELPVWGPELVVAIAIALAFALPAKLTIGPRWLLPGTEALLLVALVMASPRPRIRHSRLRRRLAIARPRSSAPPTSCRWRCCAICCCTAARRTVIT